MASDLIFKNFSEIDLDEPFFDSLKNDYPGFELWYLKKQNDGAAAYVNYKNGSLEGFLYFKDDGSIVDDVQPLLKGSRILKIGTFKINPHRTRLGERFIKIVLDHVLRENYELCYVTILDKHEALIKLFEKFGFVKEGTKTSSAGIEGVFVKRFARVSDDIVSNYPLIQIEGVKKYILGIYPQYHTVMFPDSKLITEKDVRIKDVSHTNSIHKVYVCRIDVENLKRGDILVIYRTASRGTAEYSSVVTSVCVVEEVRSQNDFDSFEDFFKYASSYSVFDKEDLRKWYLKGRCKTIKMLYNLALPKRVVRHDLIETVGLNREEYWGFFELSDEQLMAILKAGDTNDRYII